jgi:hypothetical protein
MPAKETMEKIHPCTGPCGRLTRPSRMLPLASLETFPRTRGGLCQKCYSVIRRAEQAAQREAERAAVAKAGKPRPIAKRPEVIEDERIRHIAAGLSRFEQDRRARLAKRGRISA